MSAMPSKPDVLSSFTVGDRVDCRDKFGKWYTASICRASPYSSLVRISYDGYDSNYDEVLDVGTEFDRQRIAPINTYTMSSGEWDSSSDDSAIVSSAKAELARFTADPRRVWELRVPNFRNDAASIASEPTVWTRVRYESSSRAQMRLMHHEGRHGNQPSHYWIHVLYNRDEIRPAT